MRLDIALDLDIVIYRDMAVKYFVVLKAALQWSDVIFRTFQTALAALIFAFTHLVVISTLLKISRC